MSDTRRIVYIVAEGEYSDYGIVSIWENKEDAEKVVAARGGHKVIGEMISNAHIEEWPLNEQKDLALRAYQVWLFSSGDVEVKDQGFGTGQREYGQAEGGIGAYVVEVTGPNPEHARKVGLNLITQKKAQDAGIT